MEDPGSWSIGRGLGAKVSCLLGPSAFLDVHGRRQHAFQCLWRLGTQSSPLNLQSLH